MRIDTDYDDADYVLVFSITQCAEGHMHGELHTRPNTPPDVVVRLLTDMADKHLRDRTNEQMRLEVVSPAQFRERVEAATRAKGAYSNVLPFGAPARGPARGWG